MFGFVAVRVVRARRHRQCGAAREADSVSNPSLCPAPAGKLQISVNNLAKRIKRVEFGLVNFRHHRVRCLLYTGKPDWPLLTTIQA